MERLTAAWSDGSMTTTTHALPAPHAVAPAADADLGALVRKAVAKRHFATLATVSAGGRAHAAGVQYALADGALWISTDLESRKGRNVAEHPQVALTVPVRRIPVGPPSSVHVQARATVVALDDPELRRLAATGVLKAVTSHGELERDGGCMLRVELPRRVPVYGLGMSLLALLRAPLDAGRVAEVDWA
jgi:nitroimidazol reductase NimA-like FMN-containing flavoprotein (pyridoxamine 5'-phosphate oxidase superfamily)